MNSSNSLVSIVIPVYGASEHIEKCARTLLSQTYADIEYVFVNDGTRDDSIDKLKRVVEEFPGRASSVKIIEQENKGVAVARQVGMKNVTGEYVIQVDADDWVEPDMIEFMVRNIQQAGAEIVYCDYYFESPDGTSAAEEKVYPEDRKQEMLRDMYYGRNIHGYFWNKLFRRSLYDKVQVFPEYGMRDDLVVVAQLMYYAGTISHLVRPLYHYRVSGSGSVSSAGSRKIKIESAENLMLLYDFYKDKGESTPVSGVENDLLLRIGWFVIPARDFGIFRKYPYLSRLLRNIQPSPRYGISLFRQRAMKLFTLFIR